MRRRPDTYESGKRKGDPGKWEKEGEPRGLEKARRTLYQEGLGEELFLKEGGVISEGKLEEASGVSVCFG